MAKRPPVKEKAVKHHLREIADCLDEALRLQSRVMDLTEQVYEAAGLTWFAGTEPTLTPVMQSEVYAEAMRARSALCPRRSN